MNIDWNFVSDDDLDNELIRRKNIIDGMIDLSQAPIEYLISEAEKRKSKKEKSLKDLESLHNDYKESEKIIYNAIKTPDGTILFSRHRYDFVVHTDSVTGKEYGVDGGVEYLRRIGDVSDCEDLTITDKTKFDEIRKRFHWGSYGVNGDEPLTQRSISELSNSHIQAIIDNVFKNNLNNILVKWLNLELDFRKNNDIQIDY